MSLYNKKKLRNKNDSYNKKKLRNKNESLQ